MGGFPLTAESPPSIVDLRSDTVTQPSKEMRAAMAAAEVGDAVIDVDPTTARLERETADLLGKEAALFMPSGSMTNQIAIRLHCQPGDEFLCESNCHIYNYEQGAFAQLSGLVARCLPGRRGLLSLEQFQGAVRPQNDHLVRTRLVCLENTHNVGGGTVQPQATVEAICHWAAEEGLRRHLDGARLWNAAVASGVAIDRLAGPFDSVSVCYSKGLGAPVGSALAGSGDFIARAKRARKLFGGGMRQSGIVAAGALYALAHNRDRIKKDHDRATRLAETIDKLPSLRLDDGMPETNIVLFRVDPGWGTAKAFLSRLEDRGVRALSIAGDTIRLVTHLDVSDAQTDRACEVLREIATQPSTSAGGPHAIL